MKFLGTILAIYLLALSCVPCADRDEAIGKADQSVSAPTNQKSHQHESEDCTPFCTCPSCAASAFFQPTVSYKIPRLVFNTIRVSYETTFHSYNFHFIWQPPKIG